MRIRSSLLVVLLSFIVLGVAYAAAQMWLANRYTVETPVVVETPAPRPPEELSGKIYMSLAPENGGRYGLDIYSYDPKAGMLSQETDSEGREYYTSKISPDGTKMAVSAMSNSDDEVTSDIELFIRNLATGESEEVRTLEGLYEKRNPSWSADGTQVAFAARRTNDADVLTPESWSVYVYKVGSDTYAKPITEGANPVFLPDGTLAVLKHDGIYHVNPTTGESTRTSLLDGTSQINTKFDVSRDGTKVALALPANSEVFVVPVSSWSPFQMGEEVIRIPTPAFWPAFSPGGEYLALQVVDWMETASGTSSTTIPTPTDQRLMVFSLREKTWGSSLDLRGYIQDQLFITDWVR